MAQVESWGVEYMRLIRNGGVPFRPCGGKPGASNKRKQVASTGIAAGEKRAGSTGRACGRPWAKVVFNFGPEGSLKENTRRRGGGRLKRTGHDHANRTAAHD